MIERRKILILLGLSGAAGGGFILRNPDIVEQFGKDASADSGDDVNAVSQMHERVRTNLMETEPPTPTYEFEYDRKEWKNIEEGIFRQVVAISKPDLSGDLLRLLPNKISAVELVERLRMAWGVYDKSKTLTRSIEGSEVKFEGGENAGYIYLAGVFRQGQVLVARTEESGNIRELTGEFEEII